MKSTIETKTKNINNQRLFNEINEFMVEVFNSLDVSWANKTFREEFAMLVDSWLEDIADDKKIVQFDVLCDTRNNQIDDLDQGIVHFTIRYKQKNCLNTSEIDYMLEAH